MYHRFISLLSLLPVALGAALGPRNSSTTSTACNNSPDLCSRSYSNITQLGAHDSPFLRDASTGYSSSGNQYVLYIDGHTHADINSRLVNTTLQLDAGVRLLTAQAHDNNGALHLCHTSCSLLDAGPLSSWLAEIKSWMDKNPNDVVTILVVNSDGATANTLHQQFVAADITQYTYTPPQTTAAIKVWPTLQSLIANNTRLITFVADIDPSTTQAANAQYLLNEFTFVFENPFENTSATNFSCVPDRPLAVRGETSEAVATGRLSLVNHFLDISLAFGIAVPDIANAHLTNANSGVVGNLGDSAKACATAFGKQPNFLLVDFFDQGNAIETVDKLNGITPVGRTDVSGLTDAQKGLSNAGSGRIGLLGGSFKTSTGLLVLVGVGVQILMALS